MFKFSCYFFVGGSFAVARVCLGFYGGFLIGAIELLECIFMTSQSATYVGNAFATPENPHYYWVVCTLFYAGSVLVVVLSDRIFWSMNAILAALSFGVLWIFILGSIQYCDFNQWAAFVPSDDAYSNAKHGSADTKSADAWFVGGMQGFQAWFVNFPLTTSCFAGVEVLALMPAVMKNPKKDLPFAMVGAVLVLFVSCMVFMVVIASLPPGLYSTSQADYPMSWSLDHIFNTNDQVSIGLIMPAQIAMGFGFIPCGTRLIISFSEANLLPAFLLAKTAKVAAIYYCILAYFVSIVAYYVPAFGDNLPNAAILAAFSTYFSQLFGYLM